jgi:hypothetical protein
MFARRHDRIAGALIGHLVENRRLIGVVTLLLLAASLVLPAIQTQKDAGVAAEWSAGFTFAAIGFLGPLEGQFGWFANPIILFLSGCLLLNRRAHWAVGALAVGLVVSTRLFFFQGCADSCETVVGFGSGYYLWLASALLPMLAGIADRAGAANSAEVLGSTNR